jgi:hypothetical protein
MSVDTRRPVIRSVFATIIEHTPTHAVVPELVDVAVPDAVALLVCVDVDVPDDVLVAVELDVSELVAVPVAV